MPLFMDLRRLALLVCAHALLATAGMPADGVPGRLIPAGDVRAAHGSYGVVFYYTPDPLEPSVETAKELAAEFLPGVPVVSRGDEARNPPFLGIEEEMAPLRNFPVPDDTYFNYAGHGMSAESVAAIRRTSRATHLYLVMPHDDVWEMGRKFTELALKYAEKTGAFLWDSNTRECFSRPAWKERRLDTWTDTIPRLPDHFTIHLYRSPDASAYLRAITLGMDKFALPDLALEELVSSDGRQAGNLINLVAQSLAESPVVAAPSKHRIAVAELKNEFLRTANTEGQDEGATGAVELAFVTAKRDEGDPENRVLELDFRSYEGRTRIEKRSSAFAQLWGSYDPLAAVDHDKELLDASKRARARLPELKRKFAAGLATGEHLLLKAPFARDDDGDEWMWVEILNWPASGKISGILLNDPYYIKRLRSGSRVLIDEKDVFDFLFYRADGTTEGNETGEIIGRRQR